MEAIDRTDWAVEEYRAACVTLGRDITWEPEGSGRAVDVGSDGGLLVETSQGIESLYSGAVFHVR